MSGTRIKSPINLCYVTEPRAQNLTKPDLSAHKGPGEDQATVPERFVLDLMPDSVSKGLMSCVKWVSRCSSRSAPWNQLRNGETQRVADSVSRI